MKPDELRKFRKDACLTQAKLASLLKCTQREISILETGKRKINKIKELAIITAISLHTYNEKNHGKVNKNKNIFSEEMRGYLEKSSYNEGHIVDCST